MRRVYFFRSVYDAYFYIADLVLQRVTFECYYNKGMRVWAVFVKEATNEPEAA